jgi:hypothetical protein
MAASRKNSGVKEVVAVLIGIVALLSLLAIWQAEGSVVLKGGLSDPGAIVEQFNKVILPGIKRYSFAIGMAFLAVGISFVLIDGEDELATVSDESQLKR